MNIVVIGAGEMGSAVAKFLQDAGRSVAVPVAGRSPESRTRLAMLGLPVVDTLEEAVACSGLVLSIVPPGEARHVAGTVAAALRAAPKPLTYVDCNAISPDTAREIEAILRSADAEFIDAGIIGGPPRNNATGPIIFVSGEHVASMLELNAAGLDIRSLGPTVGSASALKLSYAGVTKGLTALYALMQRHALKYGLSALLDGVLQETRPDLWPFLERAVPAMQPKAYRWVAEMREIASSLDPDAAGAALYQGAAQFFEQVTREQSGATNAVERDALAR